MKIIDTPCFALHAGDKLDLAMNASTFYTVLRVRALPNMKAELLVVASPIHTDRDMMHFEPKYIIRNCNDTIAKLEETES